MFTNLMKVPLVRPDNSNWQPDVNDPIGGYLVLSPRFPFVRQHLVNHVIHVLQ